jgi:hypothetical protein
VKFYSVAEVSHIFFRPRTKKLIRPFGFDSRLKTFVNLLYSEKSRFPTTSLRKIIFDVFWSMS